MNKGMTCSSFCLYASNLQDTNRSNNERSWILDAFFLTYHSHYEPVGAMHFFFLSSSQRKSIGHGAITSY
ncbi:hypothetical protein AAZX31_10G257200 [Glycine max]|nr:hypothetical protein JHK85_030010 [Glycine max]KAG5128526.1 hypothetical protein JHK82_029361 [Glycine max]KAG5153132.1 hypothetical protein JHK84_029604 [Glycine max]KHN06689.1 hypothetical protein glysoja_021235 [Glycine soja]